MRVLLIGAGGNLSADCASRLHARGDEVIGLTRGRTELPSYCAAVRADRRDPSEMRDAVDKARPDIVVNFLGYDVPDVALDYELLAGRVRQYIFISTAAAYVKPPVSLPITEAESLGNPFWEYASKKEACEKWLQEKRARDGFPLTIVRPSHTYSQRWFPNLVGSASCTLAARLEAGKPVFVPNDGNNLWTLTASGDFAVGLAGLVGNERAIGEAFHITGDEALSWNDIIGQTAAALGVEAPKILRIPVDWLCERFPDLTGPLRGDKANTAIFDNSKIRRLVPGFRCAKSFAAGIRESVALYRAHPGLRILNEDADRLFDRIASAWGEGPGRL